MLCVLPVEPLFCGFPTSKVQPPAFWVTSRGSWTIHKELAQPLLGIISIPLPIPIPGDAPDKTPI